MHDHRHAGFDRGRHRLKDVRFGVDEKPEAVTANPRIGIGHIVAEAVAAEYLVLGARDVCRRNSRSDRGDTGLQRIAINQKRATLFGVRLADNQRPASYAASPFSSSTIYRPDSMAK